MALLGRPLAVGLQSTCNRLAVGGHKIDSGTRAVLAAHAAQGNGTQRRRTEPESNGRRTDSFLFEAAIYRRTTRSLEQIAIGFSRGLGATERELHGPLHRSAQQVRRQTMREDAGQSWRAD